MENTRVLETERLFLREMTEADYDALYAVLADREIMAHYPYVFDEARVRAWIERNRNRYKDNGFGLWAVCLKETGEMIGDCGLTLQPIDGNMLPEIGYHIRRDCQRKGYAREAAAAVRDWAFTHTPYDALYSYCKYTNVPSFRTAEAIGMCFWKEYPDEANEITHVSILTRAQWLGMRRPVLILNGPSSSGKSTLARELQAVIKEQKAGDYEVVSIDDFMETDPMETIYEDDVWAVSGDLCERALEILRAGSGVIIDHVITSERIFRQLKETLTAYPLRTVQITCPPEVLREREQARGDRCSGSAEASADYLFPKDGYDLTVDTGMKPPRANAVSVFERFFEQIS